MRIAILGGTRFIGRALVEQLAAEGHSPLVVHRGEHEPSGVVDVEHAHVDRHDGSALAAALKPVDPDALVDVSGMNAVAADAALGAVGSSVKLVAISSG
jgi:nucleoside-diphosphate-sugar epimerase